MIPRQSPSKIIISYKSWIHIRLRGLEIGRKNKIFRQAHTSRTTAQQVVSLRGLDENRNVQKLKKRRVQQSARNYCFSLLNALSSLLIKLPNNNGLLKTWKGILLNNLEISPPSISLPLHGLFWWSQKKQFFLFSWFQHDVRLAVFMPKTLKSSVKCVFEMHLKRRS